MTSPSYGLMMPVSAGTEPGTLASEMKPKRPSTATGEGWDERRGGVGWAEAEWGKELRLGA